MIGMLSTLSMSPSVTIGVARALKVHA